MNFTALRQQESVGGLHDTTGARNAATPLAEAVAGDARLALSVLGSASDASLRRGTALLPARPAPAAVAETTARTRAAVDALVSARVAAQQPARGLVAAARAGGASGGGNNSGNGGSANETPGPQFVRYTPAVRGAASASKGASSALTVAIYERAQDPLEPPRFRGRKVARGPAAEAPAPVLHSPPRRLSAADQRAWAIPPCVSNWKNNRGYTIPLDKRLAADGRGLQDVALNDGFARLSEALYIAEQNARTELERRAELQREYARREKEQREQALLDTAQQARAERAAAAAAADAADDASGVGATGASGAFGATTAADGADVGDATIKLEGDSLQQEELARQKMERAERERIIGERRLAREREHRLEAYHGQRGRGARDAAGRDYAEAVALGTARGAGGRGGEMLYDQRLFGQAEGVAGGFGADDDYNVYTRPLFADGRSASLYRPRADLDADTYGAAGAPDAAREVARLAHADRFRPERAFAGTEHAAAQPPRTGPVQFERARGEEGTGASAASTKPKTTTSTSTPAPADEADPFGIGALLDDTRASTAKDGAHHALDSVGRSGTMLAASASFGSRDTYDARGSGRTALAFATASSGHGTGGTADEGKYAPGLTMRTGTENVQEPAPKRAREDSHHSRHGSHSSHHRHHSSNRH